MKLNPSLIKLNGDADDSNPHRSRRLSVVVGDRLQSRRLSVGDRRLSVAVGDRRQSRRLSVVIGDRRQSRSLSIAIGDWCRWRCLCVAVGTDGDASARRWRWSQRLSVAVGADSDALARRWRQSLLEASSKMVSHFNSSSSSSSTPSFVFLSCFSIIFRSKNFVLFLLWYCFYYVLDDRNSLDFRFSEMGFCFCY